MRLSYSWLILQKPIPQTKKLSQVIRVPKPSNQQVLILQDSPNSTIHPITLPSTLIPFIFSYVIEDQISSKQYFNYNNAYNSYKVSKQQYQLELQPDLQCNQGSLELKILETRKQSSFIYILMKVQNCQCFQNMMTLMMHIRYRQRKNTPVNNVNDLLKLMGSRQTNIYAKKTYASIRKELLIQQPLFTQYKYQHPPDKSIGYIWMKFTNQLSAQSQVIIHDIKLMNWLAVGKQQLVKQVIQSTWQHPHKIKKNKKAKNNQIMTQQNQKLDDKSKQEQQYQCIRLNADEGYAVMFWIKSCRLTGSGVQIPYCVQYSIQGINHKDYFKMIKFLKIN